MELIPDRRSGDGGTAARRALLRYLDMPLAEVARVLDAGPGALALVDAYWAGVERRVAAQRDIVSRLRVSLGGEAQLAELEIGERVVPEQVLLTEQRHVYLDELRWIHEATQRLERAARGSGGPSGYRIVIFHGQVSQDSDGPVEVCVPVAVPPPDRNLAWRVEPAHTEVFAPVTAAQFEVPVVLSVYDAVRQWIAAHGRVPAGAPREVFHAPGRDTICDVAIPVRDLPGEPAR